MRVTLCLLRRVARLLWSPSSLLLGWVLCLLCVTLGSVLLRRVAGLWMAGLLMCMASVWLRWVAGLLMYMASVLLRVGRVACGQRVASARRVACGRQVASVWRLALR